MQLPVAYYPNFVNFKMVFYTFTILFSECSRSGYIFNGSIYLRSYLRILNMDYNSLDYH